MSWCRASPSAAVAMALAACCLALQADLAKGQSCLAVGSLHFLTFDGQAVDFPYPCKYVLARTCSRLAPVNFDIRIKTAPEVGRGGAVSVQYVEVNTEGKTVRLLPDGGIIIDGELTTSYEYKCKFKVQRVPLGIEMALLSANVTVTVTESGFVMIRVPDSLRSLLCGLCGNYDGDMSNDFSERSKSEWFIPDLTDRNCAVPLATAYGSINYPTCANAGRSSCDWFNSTNNNRLTSCTQSDSKLLDSFYKFCIDDLCASCPDDEGSACYDKPEICDCPESVVSGVACQLAEALAVRCSESGMPASDWRGQNTIACPAKTCPYGSRYTTNATSSCTQSCSASGGGQCAPSLSCTRPIYTDGCVCPEGKSWSGSECVTPGSCGCVYGTGLLYPIGAKWIDSTCSAEIECLPNGQLNAMPITCAENSDCLLVNNSRKCDCKAGYRGDGLQECKLECGPGQRVISTNDACESCPVGTYQPSATLSSSCIPCPDGSLTPTVGSTSLLDCTVTDIIPSDSRTYVACSSFDCTKQVFLPTDLLPNGVPFSGVKHRSVWVSSNGIVSFNERFVGQIPSNILQLQSKVVAPYWFRQDISRGDSSLTIGEYSQISGKEKLPLIEKFLQSSPTTAMTSFTLLWAMVATWTSVMPYPHQRFNASENATYQLILTTDGLTTLAAFIYPRHGMHLSSRSVLKDIQMGYNGGNGVAFRFYGSGSGVMAKLDEIDSNIGVPGKWIFVISQSNNLPEQKACIQWYAQEADLWKFDKPSSYSCPCDSVAATADRNFQMNPSTLCAVSIYPSTKYNMYQMCCYERSSSSRFRRLITNPKTAGRPLKHNPNYASDVKIYFIVDEKPFLDCCSYSDNCHLYRQYRPADSCLEYRPPTSGGGGGDPHFQSLDGYRYTYNAIGEFHLIKSPIMQIQSRLGRFGNVDATDFKALACQALQPLSSRVHVELNYERSGLLIHVKTESGDDKDETLSYSGSGEKVQAYDQVIVSGTTKKLKIIFQNGYALDIEVKSGMIQQSVFVPSSEKGKNISGLLGNFDGHYENDLMLPNGTVVDCRNNKLQCVNDFFGRYWRINKNESLFWYRDKLDTASYTNYSFVPKFDNSNALSNSTDFCDGNQQCQYDFMATGDQSIALSTKRFVEEQIETYKTLASIRPTIQAPLGIHAQVNLPSSICLEITSTYPNRTELQALSSPSNAWLRRVNETVYFFQWTPTGNPSDMAPKFIATDYTTDISSAVLTIHVALCDCNNGGTCVWPDSLDAVEFVSVACNCSDGWTGSTCSENFDACKAGTCGSGVCTDAQPGQTKEYECLCRQGYQLSSDELTCLDIDECLIQTAKCGTNEFCVNAEGTYSCNCLLGYSRATSNQTCEDIDECAIGLLNQCQQVCHNQNGGYSCSCFAGFALQGLFECIKLNETEPSCQKLNCTTACVIDETGNARCTCPKGFYLLLNGSCADINECAVQPCGANATCRNTEGHFECLCEDGFKLSTSNSACEDCPPGTYGANCRESCSCGARAKRCSPVLGCHDCTAGWTGDQCKEDINECLNPLTCIGLGIICNNTIGSYVCHCKSGYEQDPSNKDCVDIDECSTLNAPCKPRFKCVNTPGSYECKVCIDGYELRGDSCFEVDECLQTGTCANEAECVNTLGSYECRCPQGYFGDGHPTPTGSGCRDINECAAQPGPCPSDSNCFNNPGSYSCVCKADSIAVGECCINSTFVEDCRAKSTLSSCSTGGVCCSPSGHISCKCSKENGSDLAIDAWCPSYPTPIITTSSEPELTTISSTIETSSEPELTTVSSAIETSSEPEVTTASSTIETSSKPELTTASSSIETSFEPERTTVSYTNNTSSERERTTVSSTNETSSEPELTSASSAIETSSEPERTAVHSTNLTSPEPGNSTTRAPIDSLPSDPAESEYLPLWITAGVLGGILVLAAITVLTVFLVRKHRKAVNLHRQDPAQRLGRADRSVFADYIDGIFRASHRGSAHRRSGSSSTTTASSNSTESYHSSPEGRVGMAVPFGPRWPKAYSGGPARPTAYLRAENEEDLDE